MAQRFVPALLFAATVIHAVPAVAEIDTARQLMEDGKFAEARKELWPAARSGNADAEEMIGVMYAMGLGVDRDDTRAFEWLLRAAMKGHAGAQAGIARYYQTGQGLPKTDLLRAFVWYHLSKIGGNARATASIKAIAEKLSADEIEHGLKIVEDYRAWMYP